MSGKKHSSRKEPDVEDTPLERRVYNLGMRLMQQAVKARIEGNESLAQKYQEKFFNLCTAIETKPIEEASHIVQDDIMSVLNTINNGRITLFHELKQAIEVKDQLVVKQIKAALIEARKSCEVMQLCLRKEIPPPKIASQEISIRIPVINNYINKDEMVLRITNLDVKAAKGRQFTLHVYLPNANPRTSEILDEPGPQNIEFRMRCIDRDRINRVLRKKIGIELRVHTKKAFGKLETVSAAAVEVPLDSLQAHNRMERTFVMNSNPETAFKNEQFTIEVTILLHSSLVTPEFSDRVLQYWTIAKGAKLEMPNAKAERAGKRTIEQLDQTEKAELTAALRSCRLLEQCEIDRFMGLSVLKTYIDETNALVSVFEKLNVEAPPKAIEQRDTLLSRQKDLIANLTGKHLSIPAYRDMLKKQAEDDAAEAQKRGVKTPVGEALVRRIKIVQEEFAKLSKGK